MLEAEAEALTDFSLEAEALIKKPKPKPGYLYSTNVSWIRFRPLESEVEALVNHEAEAFENHEAEAEAKLWKI